VPKPMSRLSPAPRVIHARRHAPDQEREWFAMNALKSPMRGLVHDRDQFNGVKRRRGAWVRNLGLVATRSPTKTAQRSTIDRKAAMDRPNSNWFDMFLLHFSDSNGVSCLTVRSGISMFDHISHTLVCSAGRWD
jgi:hypothetical protein